MANSKSVAPEKGTRQVKVGEGGPKGGVWEKSTRSLTKRVDRGRSRGGRVRVSGVAGSQWMGRQQSKQLLLCIQGFRAEYARKGTASNQD